MTFLRLLFLGILAAVPLASGCKPVVPVPSGAGFEVGTGAEAFETLVQGATVPLNRGPQGGTHIWFSARVRGLGSPIMLSYSIEDEDGNLLGDEQESMIVD